MLYLVNALCRSVQPSSIHNRSLGNNRTAVVIAFAK